MGVVAHLFIEKCGFLACTTNLQVNQETIDSHVSIKFRQQ